MFGDEQGSAQVMMQVTLDASGAMAPAEVTDPVSRNAYTPYGAVRGAGTAAENNKFGISHGWLNKIADKDTGLTYLGARYYDPLTSRFISPDPLLNLVDPNALDAFGYAGGNPVAFTDPTGLMRVRDPGRGSTLAGTLGSTSGAGASVGATSRRSSSAAGSKGDQPLSDPWIDERNFGETSKCELVGVCRSNPTENLASGQALTYLTAFDTAYRETSRIHMLLDVLGLVEEGNVGAIASIANGVIYGFEGDWGNAILSGVSAIPAVPVIKKNPVTGPILRGIVRGLGVKTGAEETHYTGLPEAAAYVRSVSQPDIGGRLRDARHISSGADYSASGGRGEMLTQYRADGYLSSYAQYDGEGDLFLVVRVTGRDNLGFATGATADFFSGNENGAGVHPHSQMPSWSGTLALDLLPAGSRGF
jgi:RHS repeat-associated protein